MLCSTPILPTCPRHSKNTISRLWNSPPLKIWNGSIQRRPSPPEGPGTRLLARGSVLWLDRGAKLFPVRGLRRLAAGERGLLRLASGRGAALSSLERSHAENPRRPASPVAPVELGVDLHPPLVPRSQPADLDCHRPDRQGRL